MAGDVAMKIKADFSFMHGAPSFEFRGEVKDGYFDSASFKGLFRQLEPWNINGRVDASVNFVNKGCRREAGAAIMLHDLSASNDDLLFSLEGGRLDLALKFDDRLTSPASQEFGFERAGAGKLKAEHGRIFFRLDDLSDFTVEKMSFEWCGGTVYGSNIHIQPGIEEYSATFFCHQLQFAEILNLFNNVNARGNGTLNGRLPVVFSRGRLRVEKGLLISAPGEKGTVSLSAASLLQTGISPESRNASSAYLDFAASSLEKFQYDWARLDIDSREDTLDVKLKLKGRPAEPLPFSYDSNGLIVRNRQGDGGRGIIHPVQLDVNFSLPVDKLFHYGMEWQKLYDR
jgi:hypothetical protein